ncbi:MAG: DUF1800 domain-containing protein [Gemmatimonadota bacterium]|nr:DUF1800 domain-containing protein [Gemmatimonadota bacterium]
MHRPTAWLRLSLLTAVLVARPTGVIDSTFVSGGHVVRRFLLAAALVPAIASGQQRRVAAAATTAPSGIAREQTADQQVYQVLNRLAFGPRPGDVAKVRAMGVDAWIDQQLHPERINDSAMDQLLARYPLLEQDQTALATQYAQAQKEFRAIKRDTGTAPDKAEQKGLQETRKSRGQLVGELESARVARAVASDRQLQEVMTDFWENHFNVFVGKNATEAYYLTDYDRTIREHALGKFRDLLGAVAHSPAMLVYLDNAQSRANPGQPTLARNTGGMVVARGGGGAPDVETMIRRRNLNPAQAQQVRQRVAAQKKAGLNENYGRELMELHTLGVDGGYTQQDVIEAARALTGWTVRPPAQGGGFIFRPEWHDAAEKTFLGHRLAAGRGEQDGEDVLDIVARSPATAHFIARQLARRFVTDSPSTALVEAAAQTFLKTDGDIRAVVRTIVTSPEFFSSRAYHTKVKSPFEVVVSAARALGAQPDSTPRTALAVAYLGEPIFGHRDPNGWPETGDAWMNTGAILNRINFGQAVAANRLPGATMTTWPLGDSLANAPRAAQVDGVVASLLEGMASPDTRKILMSGEHPLAASAAQQAVAQARMPAAADDTASNMTSGATSDATSDVTSMNATSAKLAKGAAKQQGLQGLGRELTRNPIVGPTPQLTGLSQVVGLALGAPEFQRR